MFSLTKKTSALRFFWATTVSVTPHRCNERENSLFVFRVFWVILRRIQAAKANHFPLCILNWEHLCLTNMRFAVEMICRALLYAQLCDSLSNPDL